MTVDERLARMEMRQEALVSAISGLTDVMEQTRDLVSELMAWLQEPPSLDLPEALTALAEAVEAQGRQVQAMAGALAGLPAEVARAVSIGEVR
jgi:hypothetical protein